VFEMRVNPCHVTVKETGCLRGTFWAPRTFQLLDEDVFETWSDLIIQKILPDLVDRHASSV
jgi:predicted NUDIX family phosphoesterase